MAPLLQLTLLGGFRAVCDGEPLRTLDPLRLQSLVACLVLRSGVPQDRQHLAFTFWPDSTEAQARTNLRQLVHLLRRALPEPDRFLAADRRTLLWRSDAPAAVDVAELEALWHIADEALAAGEVADAIRASQQAAALYRGDLLPSCYDAWVESDRERLRAQTLRGLARLVELLESRGEFTDAIAHIRPLMRLDPFREETHQALIRLHARKGELGLAARAYRECAALFQRELGVEPGPETRALFDDLRDQMPAAPPGGAAAPLSASALVGRQGEWRRLVDAWESAVRGAPRLLLVTGEPGIGKTHLARALVRWANDGGAATAEARCYAAEGPLAYDAAAQWLRSASVRSRLSDLEEPWRSELARLLPELGPSSAQPDDLDAATESWRRGRLFEAMARAVLGPGEPVLLLLDDLQWCDADTLAWLHYLLRFDPAARLLVLATMRKGEPGADARLAGCLLPLRNDERATEVALGPLTARETRRLAAAVAERDLEAAQLESLHEETEGNPLFVVETVRAWSAESSAEAAPGPDGSRAPRAIPAKVHAVIGARLAQLSPAARDLIGLAATVGRDFTLPVLRHALPAHDRLVTALDELLARHLVREQDDQLYDFSHDKVREIAYRELSSARRALLHERVARALESTTADAPAQLSAEIARHLERAGRYSEAIPHYRRAADRALAVHASGEAADYLGHALRLLDRLPPARDRTERELELQTALGAVLVVSDHYSGSRVWQAFTRARSLCEALGRPPSPPVLRTLALASLMRSRLHDVLGLARQLLRAAERDGDPMLTVEAHYVMGVALYWHGRIPAACRHLERAMAHYDPARAPAHLRLYIQDPAVVCGVRLAIARWHQGDADNARRLCLDSIARAQELGHPFSLAYARYFGSWVLIECGDLASVRLQVQPLVEESRKHGLATWPTMGRILDGWLRVEEGDVAGGLEQMRRGAADYQAMEVSLGFPYHQGLYAGACRRAGRVDDALDAVEQGLAMAARTRERFWDAQLQRLRGELLLERDGSVRHARSSFRRALEIARGQGALALELRAAIALARLERERGGASGAAEALERVCRDLPEGAESRELRAARDLLAVTS